MRETMGYRRKILLMEWEHQELRMKIEDIQQQLVDIDSVKVSCRLKKIIKFFICNPIERQFLLKSVFF